MLGTGKTEILKHVVRMRTEFYKRIHKEDPCMINVIIAVYRADAVQLMEQFKEDFADLVEDPKIKEEFKTDLPNSFKTNLPETTE